MQQDSHMTFSELIKCAIVSLLSCIAKNELGITIPAETMLKT